MMNNTPGGSSGHQHSGMSHLKWMGGIAVGILAVLLLMGRPLGDAIFLAILLACPLMMMGMMLMMGRGQRQEGDKPHITDDVRDRP